MNKTIQHQDASGDVGAPLGVFRDDRLVQLVPASDRTGEATRDEVAARLALSPADFEVLLTCAIHPDAAAVDCVICVPLED